MKRLFFAWAAAALSCSVSCHAGPLELTPVVQANWTTSFDLQGWSLCPANTYLAGLEISGGDYIYRLEKGICAGIRGASTASTSQTSWQASFDVAGWSVVAINKFITGLYRSSCHYLHCIEAANGATVTYQGKPVVWSPPAAVAVNMSKAGSYQCPAGSLIIGFLRGQGDLLRDITHFQCSVPAV